MSDVCEVIEDLQEKRIILKAKPSVLSELDIDMNFIAEKVKTIIKVKPKEKKDSLEYNFDSVSLISIRKHTMKISESSILRIDGIDDAIIDEIDGEKVIKTQGTNFKKVVALEFVDPVRTYTNDIFETHKVLGIEAARNLLIQEMYKVYDSSGISIDLRHVLLLADAMCFDGNIKGAVRTGIVSTKTSPLARAAFEQTEKVIFDAAFFGEKEKFHGVVENVMAGLPINAGVGNVELVMEFNNENMPKMPVKKPVVKKEVSEKETKVAEKEVKEKIVKPVAKTEKKVDVKVEKKSKSVTDSKVDVKKKVVKKK
jgi:DNA-directed RNA polymerase subunit A"